MNELKDKKELDRIIQDMYIKRVAKLGQWKVEQAIDMARHRIGECREILKEQPDQYWKDELHFYQSRVSRLKEISQQ